MVKNTKKLSGSTKIQGLGTFVRDQSKLLNLDDKEPEIKQMITDLIDNYGEIKTILKLEELLSSPDVSRSKTIPRPQNAWVLFRKNISAGLKMSVSDTSGVASYLWQNRSERESQFWNQLYQITKKIHSMKYPNYQYTPIRSCEQNKRSKEAKNNFTNDSTNDISTTPEIDNSPKIDKDIDIDLSEIDIDMVDADLFQYDSSLYDLSLYDTSLYNPSLYDPSLYDQFLTDTYSIDPSFSHIDPSLIDHSLEFSHDNFNLK